MKQDKENLFEIVYDDGDVDVHAMKFDPSLPTRPPDYIQVIECSRVKTGEYLKSIHFWFLEGRCNEVAYYFEDDDDESTLKKEEYPGVTFICPGSGHLLYMHARSYRGWQYVNKKTQDAFVAWVTEQTLFEPDSETNT